MDAPADPGTEPAAGPPPDAVASARPDVESGEWLAALRADGATRDEAMARLHGLLLRVAAHEVRRRRTSITGPELDDVAHQAADDAMVAVLAKLPTFRGESRFTTWAYRFVVLEVSSKLGRHYWRHPTARMDSEDWERLPDRFGVDPSAHSERREMVDAIRRAVDEVLTEHQRALFVAIVLSGVPLDAVASKTGSSRGAIYKAVFDARGKIRGFLSANGYLDDGMPRRGAGARRDGTGRP